MMRRLLPSLLTSALLAGCIVGNPGVITQYYSLPAGAPAAALADTPRVLAGPFEIPDYLNRPQLVIRGTGGELQLLETHRWAEALDDAILRRLNYGLRRELRSQAILQFPAYGIDDYDFQISGRLTRFEPTAEGEVTLDASWSVTTREGQLLAGPTFSSYTIALGTTADRSALVEAMGVLLDRLSTEMTVTLRSLR